MYVGIAARIDFERNSDKLKLMQFATRNNRLTRLACALPQNISHDTRRCRFDVALRPTCPL
ncbi:hypothetical protein ASH04_22360 [Rhodococcus sp. Leaf233]|nr:hypothetical protein ASH04_22360 [Rhodococcus sp. Leaf233]